MRHLAHYSRIDKIVIDVAEPDHDKEVAFWQAATGETLMRYERHPEYHGAILPGHGIGLLTQQLQQGQSRVHIDIHTDNLDAEVARLEAVGAQRVQQVHGWWVMRDPAGLLFCVIPDDRINETNAQRWD